MYALLHISEILGDIGAQSPPPVILDGTVPHRLPISLHLWSF